MARARASCKTPSVAATRGVATTFYAGCENYPREAAAWPNPPRRLTSDPHPACLLPRTAVEWAHSRIAARQAEQHNVRAGTHSNGNPGSVRYSLVQSWCRQIPGASLAPQCKESVPAWLPSIHFLCVFFCARILMCGHAITEASRNSVGMQHNVWRVKGQTHTKLAAACHAAPAHGCS